MQEILGQMTEREVLALLPESTISLRSLASLGKETIAEQLEAWQRAQDARLRHFTVQLTAQQSQVVEEALTNITDQITPGEDGNPNRRGLALYHICRAYLKERED